MSELPRTALERVLARASELQTSTSAEPGETISEARLVEIAKEVGLDVQHVRQAIAEERAQVVLAEPEHGPLLSSLGPSVVSAQRTISGSPSELLARLEAMLPRLEMMLPIRRTGDRLILEPRRDTFGNFMRSLGVGGRRFDLVRLDQLVVTATRVDDGRTVLRFDAVMNGARSSERTSAVVISTVLFLLAAAVAVPAFVFSLVLPSFAVATVAGLTALAAGGSWLTWRSVRKRFRTLVARVQNRVEFLLDEAQQGKLEQPPSLLDRMLKGGNNWQL
ncbi:MAG TPA: hypothetical protein VGE27_02375 [Gemmatimonas sp.]|uniref:hypothetical protein n=1 Tax=Gemmatimonas sp. TaxID=1962908 RepID=UPI002ED9CCC7